MTKPPPASDPSPKRGDRLHRFLRRPLRVAIRLFILALPFVRGLHAHLVDALRATARAWERGRAKLPEGARVRAFFSRASAWARARRRPTLLFVPTLLAATAALLARGAQSPPPGPYDAIVVAGCRVLEDGSPSRALARRSELALSLYRRGLAPRVVFTGGVGRHGPSEASVAAAYAVSRGLPESAALLEERSTSTQENARFAAALVGTEARVLVVTDSYHVFRARRVFARNFREAEAAGAPVDDSVLAYALPRELAAVAIYAALGRL